MIEALRTVTIVGFVLAGLFFTFVSTTGVLRLPDVYSRAHTASQADTLGAGFTLAGVALALGWDVASSRTVLLLFFIFVTNPTAAHAIARAAHESGIEPWTVDDDRTDEDLYRASLAEEGEVVADGGSVPDTDADGAGTAPNETGADGSSDGSGGGSAADGPQGGDGS